MFIQACNQGKHNQVQWMHKHQHNISKVSTVSTNCSSVRSSRDAHPRPQHVNGKFNNISKCVIYMMLIEHKDPSRKPNATKHQAETVTHKTCLSIWPYILEASYSSQFHQCRMLVSESNHLSVRGWLADIFAANATISWSRLLCAVVLFLQGLQFVLYCCYLCASTHLPQRTTHNSWFACHTNCFRRIWCFYEVLLTGKPDNQRSSTSQSPVHLLLGLLSFLHAHFNERSKELTDGEM